MKLAFPAVFLLCCSAFVIAEEDVPANPQVRLETTEGTMLIQLDGRRAPLTVKNFLALVEAGHYDGTIFHRVIPEFMIQAGGYTPNLKLKEVEDTVHNESGNGLQNLRGTVAMARTEDPHSAKAQFFINVVDNNALNPRPDRWGYAVFGYVVEGMEVADAIAALPTGPSGDFAQDVPVVPVVIEKASRVAPGQ
jgi:cyclophilin family peptidyl-prolyl cis-trans isomerase